MIISPGYADGTFEGYASLFGLPDLARDIVMPGAFTASLAQRRAQDVRLLFQHDPAEPIGIWLELIEDTRGLFCRGQLNLDVQRARELYALLKQGGIRGLSIGFKSLRSQRDAASGGRRLTRIDLWEISLVSFPLLPQAQVSAVKGESRTVSSNNALRARARKIFNPR